MGTQVLPTDTTARTSVANRFWSKVEKTDSCWIWQAYKSRLGYGQFGIGGKVYATHRAAYELEIGPIQDGNELHHECENPACVNPKHLRSVTKKEHFEITFRPKWRELASKTHCTKGHEFTPENTGIHRGTRFCRECERQRVGRYNHERSRASNPLPERPCLHCGNLFVPAEIDYMYCSKKCGKAGYYKRFGHVKKEDRNV